MTTKGNAMARKKTGKGPVGQVGVDVTGYIKGASGPETITVRDSLTTTVDMPVSGPGPIECLRIGVNGVQSVPYRDWEGETSVRNIMPFTLRFGASEFHPVPQWLLEAWDQELGVVRTFALSGFLEGAEVLQFGTVVPKSDENPE